MIGEALRRPIHTGYYGLRTRSQSPNDRGSAATTPGIGELDLTLKTGLNPLMIGEALRHTQLNVCG